MVGSVVKVQVYKSFIQLQVSYIASNYSVQLRTGSSLLAPTCLVALMIWHCCYRYRLRSLKSGIQEYTTEVQIEY